MLCYIYVFAAVQEGHFGLGVEQWLRSTWIFSVSALPELFAYTEPFLHRLAGEITLFLRMISLDMYII